MIEKSSRTTSLVGSEVDEGMNLHVYSAHITVLLDRRNESHEGDSDESASMRAVLPGAARKVDVRGTRPRNFL